MPVMLSFTLQERLSLSWCRSGNKICSAVGNETSAKPKLKLISTSRSRSSGVRPPWRAISARNGSCISLNLLVDHCWGAKASIQQLHVLDWAVAFGRRDGHSFSSFCGRRPPNRGASLANYRAVAFACAEGLLTFQIGAGRLCIQDETRAEQSLSSVAREEGAGIGRTTKAGRRPVRGRETVPQINRQKAALRNKSRFCSIGASRDEPPHSPPQLNNYRQNHV